MAQWLREAQQRRENGSRRQKPSLWAPWKNGAEKGDIFRSYFYVNHQIILDSERSPVPNRYSPANALGY